MNQFLKSKLRDPVPTSYAYSALFFASVGVFASAGAILVAIAGVFAFWRLYISKTLQHISGSGMRLVWTAVIAYYGAGALSATINPADNESVSQLVERLPFLFLPLLLQFLSHANPDKLLQWAAKGAALGVFVAVAHWGYSDNFKISRIAALSGNSNVFGYVCSLIFVFLCLGLSELSDLKSKLICSAALPLCALLVANSGSRASLLAIIMTAVIMIWHHWPWRNIWSRVLAATVLMAVVATFIDMTIVGQRLITLIHQIIQSDMNFSEFDPARIAIWSCGLGIGVDAPILGRGHDAALEAMKSCTTTSFDRPLRFSHFHNLFIDQFAKGGIVGVLSASFLLFLPIFLLARARKFNGSSQSLAAAILGVWIVQAAGALFNIGFGHDAVDAGFIYSNALLFGVVNARYGLEKATVPEEKLFGESVAGTDMSYMRVFSLGGGFALVLAAVAFLWVANTVGFNRFTTSSGGYALPPEDVSKARIAATELREFVNRFEAELTKPDSAIELPNTERFHAVASVWREEYLKLSGATRRLQSISVRKNGDDYKILLSGPICPIAVSSGLFKADPRRKSAYAALCSYFAIWRGEGVRY